jgi:hypothetical protein
MTDKPDGGRKKQHWSIKSVVVVLMLVIAAFGWLVLAAEYAKGVEGLKFSGYLKLPDSIKRRGPTESLADAVGGAIDSTGNAFRQIPNAPAVVLFSIRHRTWTVIGFVTIECLVVAIGVVVNRLEKTLAEPRRAGGSDDPN